MSTIILPERTWALDVDDRKALIPSHLATRYELAAWEQANMVRAIAWLESRRRGVTVLTGRFMRTLHRKMFDETWDHAGAYRKGKANRGAPPWTISTRVEDVIARASGWVRMHAYPADETAVRFCHRMSEVHPFERGNGRVIRLMTDALAVELGHAPFTWGAKSKLDAGELRDRYIAALRVADRDNIGPLLDFANS